MADVCFIDTETLGLDPDVNPVWEIGLILPDGTEREWHVKVSDRDISLAHPKALEISRFEERYGKTRAIDTPEDVARDLYNTITPGMHLCGAVISFDEERLRRLMWKHGFSPRWHYHLVDIEALAAGKLGMEPPWESRALVEGLGVTIASGEERHTAMGDAREVKRVYEAIFGDQDGPCTQHAYHSDDNRCVRCGAARGQGGSGA